MKFKLGIALLSLFLSPFKVAIAEDIKIMGLFKNKVIMNINGKREVLSVGESVGDIKVIQADSKKCVLSIGGKEQTFQLGTHMSVNFKPNSHSVVRLQKDPQGMYRSDGKINGKPVQFLVDTGASVVAMNMEQAKSLNLELSQDKITQVQTAGGQARAYSIELRKVSLGDITLYDVPAVVVDGNSPHEILLGMSFLKHVKMNDSHTILELTKKY